MGDRFYKFYVSVLFVTVGLFGLSGFFSWMAGDSKDQLARQIFGQVSDAALKDFNSINETVELQEKFREVSVQAAIGSVSLSPSPDDKTRIRFSGKAPKNLKKTPYGYRVHDGILQIKVEQETEGGSLNFILNGEEVRIGSQSPDVRIEVEVPTTWIGRVKFRTASADLSVGDLKLENVSLQTVSGDVSTSAGLQTPNLSVETVSGDAELQGVLKNVVVHSVSGDVDLQVQKSSSWDVDVKSISGQLENQIPTSPSPAGRIEIQTTSGNVKLAEIR